MNVKHILGMRVDQVTLDKAVAMINGWAVHRESKYVCVSNVHMCMEAFDNIQFQRDVNNADLVVPDGKPLAIGLKLLGSNNSGQVRGADLTRLLLEQSKEKNTTVGFYGGTDIALSNIKTMMKQQYSEVDVGCAISPPFRELTQEEENKYIDIINNSNIQILFVGLGCPKQEKWMAKNRGHINAVMIGVGAVFDFLGGTKTEAPKWLQNIGMEWIFRLMAEPKRLWKRYAVHNPRFIWHFSKQLLTSK
jgi:N-acetylglucosaminyldiphosphoundecaprenol N-acetyl-beta-D-mannosaminyltransferase